jgi:serine/threonine protein kinase
MATGGMAESFEPQVGETIKLFGQDYQFREHRNAPGLVWAGSGGRATVYNVVDKRNQSWGLKVFFPRYRNPIVVQSTAYLKQFEAYEGLLAAHRRVVEPKEGDARKYRELHYAILMPWVPGKTWFDCLQTAENDGTSPHTVRTARDLSVRFLRVMEQLESSGAAHTDISPGNVSLEYSAKDTQLLDLEEMFGPGAPPPAAQHAGTPGYRHPAEAPTWKASGDRYATAVLTAELLLMSDGSLARKATAGGFFGSNRANQDALNRFRDAEPYLREVSPRFLELFEEAWNSDSLESCPKVRQLMEKVNLDAGRLVSPPTITSAVKPKKNLTTAPLSPKPRPQNDERVKWAQEERVVFENADQSAAAPKPVTAPQFPALAKKRSRWKWILLAAFLIWLAIMIISNLSRS